MNIKTNKKVRLLYLLLACFLLFAFLFLPFQRSIASADEVIATPQQVHDTCNYLYDLSHVTMFVGSTGAVQVDLDYPKPIYPSTLKTIHDNNLGAYFNKRTYGYYNNGQYQNNSPSFDIMFGAGVDNIEPLFNMNLFKSASFLGNVSTHLYKSNSYIPLTNTGTTSINLEFNDFLLPYTGNTDRLDNKPFRVYLIGDSSFTATCVVSYRYLYNTNNRPGDGIVTTSPLFDSGLYTYTYTSTSDSNNIASFAPFSANHSSDEYLVGYSLSFFHYVNDLNIYFYISSPNSTNLKQVSFTNYSYVLSNEYDFNFAGVVSDFQFTQIDDPDFTSWLGSAVGGFLDFEIFPGFSLTSLLAVVVAIPLVLTLLKYFAGG